MDDAVDAAVAVYLEPEEKRVAKTFGVVFFCPSIPREEWEDLDEDDSRTKAIQDWVWNALKLVRDKRRRVAWASWFPADLPGSDEEGIYPGVLMTIERALP
jgi:hypothetical protein